MASIPVISKCLGCGSEKVEYEEQTEPMPEKVIVKEGKDGGK